MNLYRTLLKTTVLGSSVLIALCFSWYTFLGEGKNKGDYWLSYDLDKVCIQSQRPTSWYCYRAEIHRSNAIALADWGMKLGLIGTIATATLALTNKDN